MCTVSWRHDDNGYQLLCNRDEKRTRAIAVAPRIRVRDGVRFIAPTDADSGGSWISANEFGVSVCLLNGDNLSGTSRQRYESYRSRGLLLLELVTVNSVMEVCERISYLDLSIFAPFTVVALEPGLHAMIIEWNGSERAILPYGEPFVPLISSSFDPDGVRFRRRREFERCVADSGKLDANALYAFHESHGHGPDAYSPCMHRVDAETVSFSWLRVSESCVNFFYSPAAPCKRSPGETTVLALRGFENQHNDSSTTPDRFSYSCQ